MSTHFAWVTMRKCIGDFWGLKKGGLEGGQTGSWKRGLGGVKRVKWEQEVSVWGELKGSSFTSFWGRCGREGSVEGVTEKM